MRLTTTGKIFMLFTLITIIVVIYFIQKAKKEEVEKVKAAEKKAAEKKAAEKKAKIEAEKVAAEKKTKEVAIQLEKCPKGGKIEGDRCTFENEELSYAVVPTTPGCYMYTNTTCPKVADHNPQGKWVVDTFGMNSLGAGQSDAKCKARVEQHNTWCGSTDFQYKWNPPKESFTNLDDGPDANDKDFDNTTNSFDTY